MEKVILSTDGTLPGCMPDVLFPILLCHVLVSSRLAIYPNLLALSSNNSLLAFSFPPLLAQPNTNAHNSSRTKDKQEWKTKG